jgi:hypothetical protein
MARNGRKVGLRSLAGEFAVCRLGKDEPVPDWASKGNFFSITRTGEELSVVCPQTQVPPGIQREENWRCLKIQGPLDFAITGVLASLVVPLAREGISVFALSTYDTDYLLVKEEKLKTAIEILVREGHEFKNSSE